MFAIVLAAGKGSRLNPWFDLSKPLLEIHNKKLIDYSLDFLDDPIFKKKIVVGGYQYESLHAHLLKSERPDVKLVKNPNYEKNSILSLIEGLKYVGDNSFFLTNADHIFFSQHLALFKPHFFGVTLFSDTDRPLCADDMKILLGDSQQPMVISKGLSNYDCGYIGLTYVDQAYMPLYRHAIHETRLTFGDTASVEMVIQTLVQIDPSAVTVVQFQNIQWFEIDTFEDFQNAELGILAATKMGF